MTQHPRFPDAGEIRGLPGSAYTEPAILAEEKERIFFRSWHYACRADQLPATGDYLTIRLFDQQILLVRTSAGEIAAYYNVCPHRGHELCKGAGRASRIVCPYHRWTYTLEGRLIGARGHDGAQSFAREDIRLSPVRTDRLLDFVFVNPDPGARPLAKHAPGLAEQIAAACPDLALYRPKAGVDYFGGGYRANWKVLIDNFLECYHCEAAHPSFSDMMDIPGSTMEIFPTFTHQTIPWAGKPDNKAYRLDPEADALTGHFWFLFPNTAFSIFPGAKNFSVSHMLPVGADETVRPFHTFTPEGTDAASEAARAKWGLEVVNEEDKALCESVQRGYRQRGFDRGWYLVRPGEANVTEDAVRHFHRLWRAAMG